MQTAADSDAEQQQLAAIQEVISRGASEALQQIRVIVAQACAPDKDTRYCWNVRCQVAGRCMKSKAPLWT